MRYAIISDIHSNIQALEEVFSILEKENIDQILCLGDIVGYNANPIECIKVIQSHPKIISIVQGNHDIDSVNFDNLTFSQVKNLSKDAFDGFQHSYLLLNDKHKEWLKLFPQEKLIENNEISFWISHCSPNYCTSMGYILDNYEAQVSIDVLKKFKKEANLFFFGHSHCPTFIREKSKNVFFDIGRHLENNTYFIEPNIHYLINPGTIGQPRRNGITSYIILDTKERTVMIKGFRYDFKAAQKAIFDAGYSGTIARRLDPDYNE